MILLSFILPNFGQNTQIHEYTNTSTIYQFVLYLVQFKNIIQFLLVNVDLHVGSETINLMQ